MPPQRRRGIRAGRRHGQRGGHIHRPARSRAEKVPDRHRIRGVHHGGDVPELEEAQPLGAEPGPRAAVRQVGAGVYPGARPRGIVRLLRDGVRLSQHGRRLRPGRLRGHRHARREQRHGRNDDQGRVVGAQQLAHGIGAPARGESVVSPRVDEASPPGRRPEGGLAHVPPGRDGAARVPEGRGGTVLEVRALVGRVPVQLPRRVQETWHRRLGDHGPERAGERPRLRGVRAQHVERAGFRGAPPRAGDEGETPGGEDSGLRLQQGRRRRVDELHVERRRRRGQVEVEVVVRCEAVHRRRGAALVLAHVRPPAGRWGRHAEHAPS
mmetsp:Transcript_47209/g.142953  ORF Transcript_47209/g.142953 Transcript_47209/m.142953 type:complete len:324 (-) Transcript_47209:694-1665(-)